MGKWERRQVGKRESEKVRGGGSLRYPSHTFPLSHFPTISPAHSLTFTLPHFPTCSDRWRAGVGALPGPSGASEGSRWEALTAGQGAPTGQPVRPDRAPAGRMNRSHANGEFMRPAGAPDARVQHRWVRSADGASHRLPSSAPPARKLRDLYSNEDSGSCRKNTEGCTRPLTFTLPHFPTCTRPLTFSPSHFPTCTRPLTFPPSHFPTCTRPLTFPLPHSPTCSPPASAPPDTSPQTLVASTTAPHPPRAARRASRPDTAPVC